MKFNTQLLTEDPIKVQTIPSATIGFAEPSIPIGLPERIPFPAPVARLCALLGENAYDIEYHDPNDKLVVETVSYESWHFPEGAENAPLLYPIDSSDPQRLRVVGYDQPVQEWLLIHRGSLVDHPLWSDPDALLVGFSDEVKTLESTRRSLEKAGYTLLVGDTDDPFDWAVLVPWSPEHQWSFWSEYADRCEYWWAVRVKRLGPIALPMDPSHAPDPLAEILLSIREEVFDAPLPKYDWKGPQLVRIDRPVQRIDYPTGMFVIAPDRETLESYGYAENEPGGPPSFFARLYALQNEEHPDLARALYETAREYALWCYPTDPTDPRIDRGEWVVALPDYGEAVESLMLSMLYTAGVNLNVCSAWFMFYSPKRSREQNSD